MSRFDDLHSRRLMLDKKQNWPGGVRAGLAPFWRVDPIWVRIGAVTGAFMFRQLVVALYAACWLVLDRG